MLKTKTLVGLDILRFFMALIMVIFHIPSVLTIQFFKFNGWYATSTFFILSGFILTYVYQNRILKNDFSNSEFLIKRLATLYPIHILTLAFYILQLPYSHFIKQKPLFPIEVSYQQLPNTPPLPSTDSYILQFSDYFQYIVESLLLVHAWDWRYLLMNGPSWSISALLFFYCIFSFLVKKISKIKHIELFTFILWLAILTLPIYLIITENFANETIGLLHRNPLLLTPSFIAGICLFYLSIKHKAFINKHRWALGIIGLSGFYICFKLVQYNPYQTFYLTHNGLFLLMQMALIASFMNFEVKTIKIASLCQKLGRTSLTIYMCHFPAMVIFFKLIGFQPNDENPLNHTQLVVFLTILVVISYLLQTYIFTPLQRYLSKKLIKVRAVNHYQPTQSNSL